MKTRYFAWVVPVTLVLTAVVAEAAPATFPYKAHIVTHQARVRGGPGQAYSVTGYLAFGAEVDVYRHDPGGWCAIRPPDGSYSWVLADAAQLLPNGLAKVIRPGVPSYVGGVEVPDRNLSHVTLRQGELLEVLDARRIGQDPSSSVSAPQTWLKIRPPSGEFRWVHVSSLRAVGSGEPLPSAAAASAIPIASESPLAGTYSQTSAIADRNFGEGPESATRPMEPKPQRIPTVPIPRASEPNTQAHAGADTTMNPGLASTAHNSTAGPNAIPDTYDPQVENLTDASVSGVVATSGALPPDDGANGWRPMNGSGESTGLLRERPAVYGSDNAGRMSGLRFGQPVVPSRNITPLTPDEFTRQAQSLELDLANRLSQGPETWNLSDLRQRAVDLRAAAPDGATRDRADKITAKIAQAERVAAEWRRISGGGASAPTETADGQALQTSIMAGPQPASPQGMPLPPSPAAERPTRIAPPPTAIAVPPVSSQQNATSLRSNALDAGNVIRTGAVTGPEHGSTSPVGSTAGTSAQGQVESKPVPTREEIARELLELRRQRFDVVGRLIRAQVRRPGDPPYALTDDDGRILTYVNPGPGTLMRSYVGRTVGVMGKFSGSGETRLLTAEHVAVLDSGRPTPAPPPANNEASPVRFAETPPRSMVR